MLLLPESDCRPPPDTMLTLPILSKVFTGCYEYIIYSLTALSNAIETPVHIPHLKENYAYLTTLLHDVAFCGVWDHEFVGVSPESRFVQDQIQTPVSPATAVLQPVPPQSVFSCMMPSCVTGGRPGMVLVCDTPQPPPPPPGF